MPTIIFGDIQTQLTEDNTQTQLTADNKQAQPTVQDIVLCIYCTIWQQFMIQDPCPVKHARRGTLRGKSLRSPEDWGTTTGGWLPKHLPDSGGVTTPQVSVLHKVSLLQLLGCSPGTWFANSVWLPSSAHDSCHPSPLSRTHSALIGFFENTLLNKRDRPV